MYLLVLARLPDGTFEFHVPVVSHDIVRRIGDMVRSGRWDEVWLRPAWKVGGN